ncbi:hypothetical protein DPMN_053450 [Dreissena polymorpha]|uniref:Transmembrane protein 26 n=2 Tax=Dreissena polymorpha TaxID=45954 RepID=A0A9D4HQP0_DREPO|nr:hypothetical protein DPMN_053450 [Dreissena polymorpha]
MIPVLWLLRLNDMQTTLINSSNNISSSNNNTLSSLMGNTKFASLLSGQNLTSLLEQSMMILIIICRWMLPRGRIDRNSMSQLLIMYSAIGADILDFSDTFDRIEVARNKNLAIVVLAVWSWSLLQFTVVITTAFTFRRRRGRETEPGGGGTHSANSREDISETLSIMMVLLMQDGPFLVTRGYMISKGVFNYMIMFFSLKNALTLILGLYRLCVLYGCVTREGNDLLRKSEIARSLDSLDDIDCQSNPKSKTVKGTNHQRF